MTTRTFLVDGMSLDDPAGRWRLEQATRSPSVAVRRRAQLDLPMRDGTIPVLQGWGTGTVLVSVLVRPTRPDGSAGDVAQLEDNRRALVALLAQAGTVGFSTDTTVRSVQVADVAISDPVDHGRQGMIIQATFTVQPFWAEGTTPVVSAPAFAVPQIVFPEFAGCTGTLQDAVIRLTGPFGRMALACAGTGLIVGALPAGQCRYVDLAAWSMWDTASSTQWTPAGATSQPDWPAGGMLALRADPAAQLAVTVDVAGQTTATQVGVRARRWFL